jgi:hypothetical protein
MDRVIRRRCSRFLNSRPYLFPEYAHTRVGFSRRPIVLHAVMEVLVLTVSFLCECEGLIYNGIPCSIAYTDR